MPRVNETLDALNLSADPFAATTPMESLFPGAMRRAMLDQLLHLSRETQDIIALMGPSGSGKTALGDFFARQAARDQIVARARASLLTSPSQLLEEMFKAFVLDFPPQASIADLKAALLDYFAAVHRQSRTVVLIVDDAHELGDDAFALLTRLALVDNVDGTFHLILLGEPQLFDMLDYTCPLKNGAQQFLSLQLPAMSLDETRDYLRFRLNCVGFSRGAHSRSLPFSNRQIEKIHKQSAGQPGAINLLAGEMLNAPQGGAAILDLLNIVPRKYAFAVMGLLAVLTIAFFSGGDKGAVSQSTQRTITVPVALPGSTPEQDAAVVDGQDVAVEETSQLVSAPVDEALPGQTATSAPLAETVSLESPVATTPVTPAPAVAVVTPPAPAPTNPLTVAEAPATDSLATQRARILALPPAQFTLQVLGSSSRRNVEEFVARHAASSLSWYETRNNGNPWFVIIHGAYASRNAAQAAVASLPAEIRNLQPWVRSVGDVQNDIRAQN
ncbi:MAG: AAA family ATPase [Gammaproteobacteria bacterium]|nr:AAA family ATPase [Gammaproteobacteria bacterium]MDP2139883.1 AAA family ATPase [Gammaproteobacteria bacterium]MDP2347703.1 AAA family ATPase [Gammaproteobacteria bacterium]